MEIDIYILEEKLLSAINDPIKIDEDSSGNGKSASSGGSSGEGATKPQDIPIKYPDVKSDYFQSMDIKTSWWEENRILFAYGLLVVFAAFISSLLLFYVYDKTVLSKNLLFFFGVVTLLFVGLVVLACFIVKASEKHHAEKNERVNKMLAFRLKLLESVFELENRTILAEKNQIEKEISITEKERLYALDEQQRASDHKRRMQLKKNDILESYMKHLVELTKSTEKKQGE